MIKHLTRNGTITFATNKPILYRSFNVDAEAILAVACSVVAIGCFLFSFKLSDDPDADRRTFQSILNDMLHQGTRYDDDKVDVLEHLDPSLDIVIKIFCQENPDPAVNSLFYVSRLTIRAAINIYTSLEPVLGTLIQYYQNLDNFQTALVFLVILNLAFLVIKYQLFIKKELAYLYFCIKEFLR